MRTCHAVPGISIGHCTHRLHRIGCADRHSSAHLNLNWLNCFQDRCIPLSSYHLILSWKWSSYSFSERKLTKNIRAGKEWQMIWQNLAILTISRTVWRPLFHHSLSRFGRFGSKQARWNSNGTWCAILHQPPSSTKALHWSQGQHRWLAQAQW